MPNQTVYKSGSNLYSRIALSIRLWYTKVTFIKTFFRSAVSMNRKEVFCVSKPVESIQYQKPVMKTVVTPTEVRDIEQPCAFNFPDNKKKRPKK